MRTGILHSVIPRLVAERSRSMTRNPLLDSVIPRLTRNLMINSAFLLGIAGHASTSLSNQARNKIAQFLIPNS